jgi:hypothetical protein
MDGGRQEDGKGGRHTQASGGFGCKLSLKYRDGRVDGAKAESSDNTGHEEVCSRVGGGL